MIIDIALCKSRKQKKWQNKKMPWADLVKKFENTHRTAETISQYLNASKERQSEIKDIGGFVGGYLTNGLRTPISNIAHRQLITLDIDFGVADVWDSFTDIYGEEAVMYSTHTHTPDNPRYRLIIPLNRAVGVEEYEAIARRIAANIGMELFDSTTFQPQRLMYWPSTASDGEYVYEYQGSGKYLNADAVLKTYTNWKDISSWPVTDNEDISVKAEFKKIGNPEEKPGLIGAFCRAFDIQGAVEEFLVDEYEEAGEDRLTYKGGTTAAGVVLYGDGAFAYSHHNTDPAHGKLLNAFDLVRIHLYGDLDKDKDLPMTKSESYKAMCAFASELAPVKNEIKLGAFDVFNDETERDGDLSTDEDSWQSKLKFNGKGEIESTIDNIVVILHHDSRLKNRIKFNEFDDNIYIMDVMPWDDEVTKPRPFEDSDDAGMRHYVEKVYGIFNTGKTYDAINISARNNSYHPIRDYIDSVHWDGTLRIDDLLIKYMGAENTKYTKMVTRKALVAAVARVYKPGIKFDTVLTLVGAQGIRKSTFFGKLGGEWFSDSFTTVQGKESFEQLKGSWLIEIAELSGFKKAEVELIKQFLSKRSDKFREAYGHRIRTFPRQCVFFGTTNEIAFLKDYTGNRRFWPVMVTGAGNDKIDKIPVDQIWAEAKLLWEAGEPLYLDEEMEKEATTVQAHHTEEEERVGIVENFLNLPLPLDWRNMNLQTRRAYIRDEDVIAEEGCEERLAVCVAEIWSELFNEDFAKMTSTNTKYIHQMLSKIPGWVKSTSVRKFAFYGRQRAYVKLINGLEPEYDGSETRKQTKVKS